MKQLCNNAHPRTQAGPSPRPLFAAARLAAPVPADRANQGAALKTNNKISISG